MQNTAFCPSAERMIRFFEEISRVPRRFYLTEPIADYLCNFAKERGLSYLRDEYDNVIIKKQKSKDCTATEAVILQAHTDMVLAKRCPECNSFDTEGVSLLYDGDFIRAKDSSLGADDGIGLAYILAILDDDTLIHPEIEAVLTSNEEVGLLGAAALDCSALFGRMLINLDSDEEGIFTAGCAGGSNFTLSLPLDLKKTLPCRTLTLRGLPGGHSGVEIHKNIANATLLLSEALKALSEDAPLLLAKIDGGEASNAIPTFASASFFSKKSADEILKICNTLLAGYNENVGDGAFTLEDGGALPCLEKEKSTELFDFLLSLPRGILSMENPPLELPRTSLNLGKTRTADGELTLYYALRSSVDGERVTLENRMTEQAKSIQASVTVDGVYPAWSYRESSPLRDACLKTYRRLYDKDATVTVIHAGLECGILGARIHGLDAISFGPDIKDIHTVDERLSVSSAKEVYRYLCELIATLASKKD